MDSLREQITLEMGIVVVGGNNKIMQRQYFGIMCMETRCLFLVIHSFVFVSFSILVLCYSLEDIKRYQSFFFCFLNIWLNIKRLSF